MSNSGHGSVGTREQQFTELLPLRKKIYLTSLLYDLALVMKSAPDGVHDGADPEENLWMPAGYTYFGQFIDHDLTFDNTSSLNPHDLGMKNRQPSNLRTPRFDLDSVYGDGPDAQPFMYDNDGASLLFKDGDVNKTGDFPGQANQDLLRSPKGRAIIGDKRNDENVIVGQIQLVFVRYHNAVVKKLQTGDPTLTGTALFEKARNEVRWTYQKLVLKDFLPRIVQAAVFQDLQEAKSTAERAQLYALYTEDKRANLPREFVVAAYRFGHSAVRQGYRLNPMTMKNIFPGSDEPAADGSLLGFKPLLNTHVIDDFGRFFPNTPPAPPVDPVPQRVAGEGPILQFAYKLDTNIVDPLGVLPGNVLPTSPIKGGALEEAKEAIAPLPLPVPDRPSLALLNLLRGNIYRVQGGQEIARVLRSKGLDAQELTPAQLVIRTLLRKDPDADGSTTNIYNFVPIASIAPEFQKDTPLWVYILAEAQAPIADYFQDLKLFPKGEFPETELLNGVGARTQLGWVGGRIVSEVFYGLLDSDDQSYINAAPTGWEPMLGVDEAGNKRAPIFLNLLAFIKDPVGGMPAKDAGKIEEVKDATSTQTSLPEGAKPIS